tara:strand:+ start:385 stop:642 length:258 start_codon:yes stop_codon:yes gene_type:complete
MDNIEEVEFTEQKEYNVLQLTGFLDSILGVSHEAKPRAIYSLSKIIDKIMKDKDVDRNGAFKTFELEVRLPLLETENSPIYLNDI